MTELFDIIRLLAVVAVMISACVGDWKKREASDAHWIVLGMFGILCMTYVAFSAGMRGEYSMMIIGSAMILISVLYDIERRKSVAALFYIIMALMFIIPLYLAHDDTIVQQFMIVPASFVIFLLLFLSGAIKGGADVKCLIVLAFVFTTYPEVLGFPMIDVPSFSLSLVFPFSLMVLFHAALFSVFLSVYFVMVNLRRRDVKIPQMLMGYRMDLVEAKGSFVWPMEYVDDGKAVIVRKAQDTETLYDLEAAGAERIWVTPMVPFLIPITLSIIFVSLIGNMLFLPF